MAETILIPLSEIVKNTPLSGGLDVDKYVYTVKDVQVSILEPALGTALYDKMKTDYANPNTYTGDYKTLYEEYIVPILRHSVAAEYISIAGYIVDNNGIYRKVADNTELVSRSDSDDLSDKQRAKADIYIARMIRFLESDEVSIDEYDNEQATDYDVEADDEIQTYGGLHF